VKIISAVAAAGAGLAMLSAPAGLAAMATPITAGTAVTGTAITATASRAKLPACTPRTLGFTYVGGLAGAGNDFGTIVAWDTSASACALTNPIRIGGLNRAGRRITRTERFQVTGPDVLTASGSAPVRGLRLKRGETAAFITLSADYRDDPAGNGGLCSPRHQIEPAIWLISFARGGPKRIANADPAEGRQRVRGLPGNHGLLTCRGELNTPAPIVVGRQP
jgi:hypothetical protein